MVHKIARGMKWRTGLLNSYQDFKLRDLTQMEGETRELLGEDSIVTFDSLQLHFLEDCVEWMKALGLDRELVVSAMLPAQPLFISPGRWKLVRLITLIQAVTHSELRPVDDTFFLGLWGTVKYLQARRKLILQCEHLWPLMQRVVAALAENPLNEISPFDLQTMINPMLIPYPQLEPNQKEFVLQDRGLDSSSESLLGDRKQEIECFVFPAIRCRFVVPGEKEQWSQRGFGPTSNYGWLGLRTVRANKGSDPR